MLHVDRLFLGVHGMDARAGLTTPNLVEAETNQALVDTARRMRASSPTTRSGARSASAPSSRCRGRPAGHRRGPARRHARPSPKQAVEFVLATAATDADAALGEDRRDRARTSRRLADGREIIYFDDTPRPREARRRGHPSPRRASRVRRDPATTPSSATGSPWPGTAATAPSCRPKDECPLCPTGDRQRPLRDARGGLRRRGLREPVPLATRPVPPSQPDVLGRRGDSSEPAGSRPLRGRLLHERPRRRRSPT